MLGFMQRFSLKRKITLALDGASARRNWGESVRTMDAALARILDEQKLTHFGLALQSIGLTTLPDVALIEDEDLVELGFKKLQLRAFERVRMDAAVAAANQMQGENGRMEQTIEEHKPDEDSKMQAYVEEEQKQQQREPRLSQSHEREHEAQQQQKQNGDEEVDAVSDEDGDGVQDGVLEREAAHEEQQQRRKQHQAQPEESQQVDGQREEAQHERQGELVAPSARRAAGVGVMEEQVERTVTLPAGAALVLLDGMNIMRAQFGGGNAKDEGVPRGDTRHLRVAYDWFREHGAPEQVVRIYLYRKLQERLREDRHLHDIQHSIEWTPSGADVDAFLIRVAAESPQDLRASPGVGSGRFLHDISAGDGRGVLGSGVHPEFRPQAIAQLHGLG